MELHLPYYELKEMSSTSSSPRERHIDVTFLNSNSICPQHSSKYTICNAGFSLLLTGSDRHRWTAYSFYDHADAEEPGEDDCELEEDPIASPREANNTSGVVSANKPIGNPREYFLLVLSNWLPKILRHWQEVVSYLDHETRGYVCPNFFFDRMSTVAIQMILNQHAI